MDDMEFRVALKVLLSNRRSMVAIVLFAFLFALSWTLPQCLNGSVSLCFLTAIFLTVPLAFLICLLLTAVDVLKTKESSEEHAFSMKVFFFILIPLLLCWGVYFLVLYPGICTTDSNDIFKMIWGLPFESNHFRYDSLNNHHPAFYIFLNYLVLQPCFLLGLSQPISVGLLALMHMITLAVCCAFFSAKLYLLTGSRIVLVFCFVFFFFNPLIAQYSLTVWKDIVFASFFLVFLVELFALVKWKEKFFTNKADVVILACASILCIFLRNNGLLAIGITFIVLPFVFKAMRKEVAKLFAVVVIVSALVLGPLFSVIGVKSGHFAESVSIPLQQVSRVLADDNAVVNEEQEVFFSTLLPTEQYQERYNPQTPNPIKFSPQFNDAFLEENEGEFFAKWLQLGLQNPGIYFRAWCAQTIPFWSCTFDDSYYIAPPGYSLSSEQGVVARNLTNGIINYGMTLSFLDSAIDVFEPIFNMGWLAWMVLFAVLVLFCSNRHKFIVCLLPLVLWWASFLIAAPAGDFRYMFPVHLALPLVLVVVIFDFSRKEGPA